MSSQDTYLDNIASCIRDVSNSIDAISAKDIVLSISELTDVLKESNKLLKQIAQTNKVIAMNAHEYVAKRC